jgi:hypothetical protein
MICCVRPERRQRRARCWRDSLAHSSTSRGSKISASSRAAVVVMVAMVRLSGDGDGGQLVGGVRDGGERHHSHKRQSNEKGSHDQQPY